MRKGNDTFMLWTDRDGNELHIEKGDDGRWRCVELDDAKFDIHYLLAAVTSADEPNFDRVVEIAKRNGFEFDDDGHVVAKEGVE